MAANVTYGLRVATVSVNPPSLATITEGSVAVTVPGVKSDDVLIAVSPFGVAEDRYILKRAAITAADTVTLEFVNESTGTVDPAALNLTFVWLSKPTVEVGFPMGYPKPS
jgi:hypothetical protein